MDLFDLLDRECDRLVADFEDCLPASDAKLTWLASAESVLGRMATYTLAIDQVLEPALLVLQFDGIDALGRTHARLRRVVAEALLSLRGPRPNAEKAMRGAQQILLRYRLRLRRDFYPPLYRLLSPAEALVLSDDLLQWLDRHCRQIPAAVPVQPHPALPRRAAVRPPADARLPTLHHVVPRAGAARPSFLA